MLSSITLAGPGGSFGWLSDIDVSDYGRLVMGTTSGYVAQNLAEMPPIAS